MRALSLSLSLACLATFATEPCTQISPLELDHHMSLPTCQGWGGIGFASLVNAAANWKNSGLRLIDIQSIDPVTGFLGHKRICAPAGGAWDRPWAVDVNVTQAGAEALANQAGMVITALAPLELTPGQVTFVSLRETLPVNVSWRWVPATTVAGIQQWLAANPSFQPYSVDSLVVGGVVRETSVLAMASTVRNRPLRQRRIVFSTALASLPLPSVPCGERVICIDQVGPATFHAIIETPLPGQITDYIDAVDYLPVGNPDEFHAGMDRSFCNTVFTDASGVQHATSLQVNNAGSLYDVQNYPSGMNYRGCPGTFGTPLLSISTPGNRALGGATLSVTATPVAGPTWLFLGIDRLNWVDLASAGAPGCLLIPVIGLAVPMQVNGSAAAMSLSIPASPCLAGARFYAQALSAGAPNPIGIATSNMYMVTIR